MQRIPNCTCKICGKAIYRRPADIERSEGKVYCSLACFGKSCRTNKHCPICGKELVNAKSNKTCSRACANIKRSGIKYKQPTSQQKDRAKETRAIKKRLISLRGAKCQRCDYSDANILVVHHIIRRSDGGSNDIENLELICPNCHAEVHFYGVKHSKRGEVRL
jgi:5-methylcytosine-specific restriction endonuclease McrA